MYATIEIGSGRNAEVIAELSTGDFNVTEIAINEISQLKISVFDADSTTRVFAGLMQLRGFLDNDESKAYFVRGDISLESMEKNSFFSAIFVNQVGASQIIIEHNDVSHTLIVEIESTKVEDTELLNWIATINAEFPLFKLPNLMTPLSTIGAQATKSDGFRSLYSFIVDCNQTLVDIEKKISSKKYLKRSYHRFVDLNGTQVSKKDFTNLDWVKPGSRWRPTHASSNSVVRKGSMSFEPEKYPGLTGHETLQNELNGHLYLQLNTLSRTCKKYLLELKNNVSQIEELRTQFGENIAKVNLFIKYEEEIISLIRKSNDLVKKMAEMGVTGKVKTQRIRFDSRYLAICKDITLLDEIISQLFQYALQSEHSLGLLGLDFIFEYYAFASIIRELKRNGFEIEDATATSPVNDYISLKHISSGYGIRIFYDQLVPKAEDKSLDFPLWDYWPGNIRLRPDFILHLYSDSYEEVVIFDAKYKSIKKCKSDFNSFQKQQSILVKYGTKMFLAGERKAAPVYVGALCCTNNPVDEQRHEWLLKSEIKSEPLAQCVGITSLHSSNNNSLGELLSELWSNFASKASRKPGQRISGLKRPDAVNTLDRKFKKKYRKNLNVSSPYTKLNNVTRSLKSEDRAPSLSENDAKLIKGMLARGDIPQHINQYFGVNAGRISDIKNGKTFTAISSSTEEELPLPGPYPSIRELLEKFPEIRNLLKE